MIDKQIATSNPLPLIEVVELPVEYIEITSLPYPDFGTEIIIAEASFLRAPTPPHNWTEEDDAKEASYRESLRDIQIGLAMKEQAA